MSFWTYIQGFVVVEPMGRTQEEKRYILETVLAHLPRVSGSEGDMNIHIIQKSGYNSFSSHDELGYRTENLIDEYGRGRHGHLKTQSKYYLLLEGSLRDVTYLIGIRMLSKWLCRLAKRIEISDILLEISGWDGHMLMKNEKPFLSMYEWPSWCRDYVKHDTENWCEYLMWKYDSDVEYDMDNLVAHCQCGEPVSGDEKYCRSCGAKLIFDPDKDNELISQLNEKRKEIPTR